LLLAKISIVIHLGINPESGGSPPNDNSNKGINICMIGALDINLFISILVEDENKLKIKKIGAISIE